jgi:lactoylglutathione lyase
MGFQLLRYALAAFTLAAAPASAEPGPAPISANHLALHVQDLETSARFYTDVLGLQRMPTQPSPTIIWLETGGFELHLIGGRTQPVQTPREVHLAFRVSDLQPITARLDTNRVDWGNFAGEAQTISKRVDGVSQIYLRDPDGYWIELNQLGR